MIHVMEIEEEMIKELVSCSKDFAKVLHRQEEEKVKQKKRNERYSEYSKKKMKKEFDGKV